MPAYLVIHPREQRRDDLRLSGDDLTLRFEAGWAIFTDSQGDCLAIPSGQGASIQRDDEPLPEEEPADNTPALNK
ncbi:predicted protein [Streptomyces viridosporus ATCC 14672]|uniref:Predicted protein n=1 Tax=Streptomyces viridosporus (strain ATCC 14672 / DSM 40746 / JCM 4963 / KCTC 9882 / NRRL B-12104 / FH 1290) TaxID=566461 RepID=D6A4D0_STRV1|nr:hypothetical protein [Streptomyces viridosporus]EFE65770.1 predicted protein [Streptomyces viridosporus ATCC 14672]